MSPPRITVLTPSLNQARFLERAICSVLDQGHADLEYIVVDGGSTDGSADLIRRYRRDLAASVSEPDGGPADALNRGLSRATGDLVGVLHADQVYLPGALAEVLEACATRGGPAWVVGRCLRVDEEDQVLGWLEPSVPRSLASFLMHDSGLLPSASTFLPRRWLGVRGFDASLRHAYHYECCCRLLAGGLAPALVGRALAAWREEACPPRPGAALASGREYLAAALRHAQSLPPRHRYDLWANCDRRRRIYSLAEAEMSADHARRYMWEQVLRRPWWLTDDQVRRTLWHGVARPLPVHMVRPAA